MRLGHFPLKYRWPVGFVREFNALQVTTAHWHCQNLPTPASMQDGAVVAAAPRAGAWAVPARVGKCTSAIRMLPFLPPLRPVAWGITDEKALAAIHQLVEELEEGAREAEIAATDTRK